MTQATIGELLRRHRLEAVLTQKDVAKRLRCHDSHVSRVEHGVLLPTPEYIELFIKALALEDAERREIESLYQQAAEGIVDSPLPQSLKLWRREDWSEAPDVSIFYGRQEELFELKQWIITDRCRLVGVFGMGGIGKTALAAKLGEAIKGQFDHTIWRSLLNAPPIEDVLTSCIQTLSNQQERDLPKSVDRRIALLIDYLHQYRCLLVLDNTEAILQEDRAGHYRDGYEEYGDFIRRVGETKHQSCLLLTSREKPKEFARLEGEASPVRALKLIGLGQIEGREVLKESGLFGTNETWTALIYRYSGNPLALRLISESIREVFDGDIAGFLNEEAPIFGDVRDLLNQQFDRLSELEREIMYWLAIEREVISPDDLQENIMNRVSKRELLEDLGSLRRRSLVEQSGASFTLQNVVMEYMTDRLIERVCDEITTGTISRFKSHTLIKAQAKEYVRESQIRLILKPVADRLLAIFRSKEAIVQQLMKILSVQRAQSLPLKTGYVGGNVLNLLHYLKRDLTGFDFSHLAIWQAYLQGVDLHDVNFAYTDLTTSVFTETFGGILSVAFSPNGKLLAAGTTNDEIRLWRITDAKPLLTCEGHTDWVRSVTFNSDGDTLASGSNDQTIRLWNVSTGQCFNTLSGHTNRVLSVAFSSDGSILASSSDDQTIRLWDVNSGQCVKILTGHANRVVSVTFSPDGNILASGSEDQTVQLWDVNTGQQFKKLSGHTNRVWSVAFSLDGSTLVSGSRDQSIRLWDVNTGRCFEILSGHTNWVWSVDLSTDGNLLVSGGEDQTVRLWNISLGQCLRTLLGHTNPVRSVVLSPDGDMLASGGEDQTVRLWDVDTGQCLKTLQGHANPVRSITLNPNSNILASGGEDQTVRLWDVDSGQCLDILAGHTNRVWSVAFSPDGSMLASGSEDQTVRLWDLRTARCFKILQGHTDRIWSVAFSPDGRLLASCSDDQAIRLWDVRTGQCLKTLQKHADLVLSVIFSPDGNILASGSEDQTVCLWDVDTGQCLKTLHGHTNGVWSVVFSPDGVILASGSDDKTIRLWDVRTGQHLKTLQEHIDRVWSLAFSPDGRILANSGNDQALWLWDVHNGQHLKTLRGHTRRVRSVVFGPNGRILVSGSDDETIKFWDVKSGLCLKTLRSDRPYERMNITGVIGLTEGQKTTLKALGAVED